MLNIYRRKRLEKGLKQRDLEKLTGIEQTRISYIERGLPPKKVERKILEKVLEIKEDENL